MKTSLAKNLFQQIAFEAGVSSATVTLALQDSPRLSQDTKEKVFRTSRQLGYRASRIKGDHELTIAVFNGLVDGRAWMSTLPDVEIWQQLCKCADQYRASLHLYPMTQLNEKIRLENLPSLCRRDQVDGVILMNGISESFVEFLKEMHIPTVIIGNADCRPQVDQITLDVAGAVSQLLEKMVEQGHRRFGFLSLSEGLQVNRQILNSFQQTLSKYNCFDEKLVCTSKDLAPDSYNLLRSLLKLKKRPTFVYTTTHQLAYQSAIAAASLGIDSHFEIGTVHAYPTLDMYYPLHLVAPLTDQIAKRTFDRLMELIRKPDQPPVKMTLSCQLLHDARKEGRRLYYSAGSMQAVAQ